MTAGLWNSGIQEINAVECLCLPAVVVQFLFATLPPSPGGDGGAGARVQSAAVSGAVAFERDRDRDGSAELTDEPPRK